MCYIAGTSSKRVFTRESTIVLNSHRALHVGDCVPFYFCPRSVMLYVIYMSNHPELEYRGGQGPVVHLGGGLTSVRCLGEPQSSAMAFTPSNAGSSYFEDYSDLSQLNKINWAAVEASKWSGIGVDQSVKEDKQAEFLGSVDILP